jgi:alcohol dehydrogenase class IV
MEFNLLSTPARYALIAQALGVHEEAPNRVLAQLGLEKVKSMIKDCEIDHASVTDRIDAGAIDGLATAAMEVQRLLKNNVREVSRQDAVDIYKKAFGYDE